MTDIVAIIRQQLLEKTAAAMESVLAENPAHWPAGLRVSQFEALHPIIDHDKVAGFVGWQTITHPDGYKAGYYSVGLLPEHRGKGLAKAACEKLIAEHKGSVAQVRALIMEGNVPSEKLAKSLGVAIDRHDPRNKSAAVNPILRLLEGEKKADASDIASAALMGALPASVLAGLLPLALDADGAWTDLPGVELDRDGKPWKRQRPDFGFAMRNMALAGLAGGGLGAGLEYAKSAAVNPILAGILKSLAGGAAGAGVAGVENATALSGLSDENKHTNYLLNALTGAGLGVAHGTSLFRPSLVAAGGALPVKEMALRGLNSFEKDAPLRAQTAENALRASEMDRDRAHTLLEQAKTWTTQDKLLAGALGLGGLGLGVYGYNSFKGKGKGRVDTKLKSDPALRHKSKLRIDIPADAVNSDFYEQLAGLAAGNKPLDATFSAPVKEASALWKALHSAPAKGLLGAGIGAGTGMYEKKLMTDAGLPVGHVGDVGLIGGNAVLGFLLGHPAARTAIWRGNDLGEKILNSSKILGGKLGVMGAALGADQGIGLMGKAQEAAKGLGDAGKAMSEVSQKFKEEGTKSLDDVKRVTGNAATLSSDIANAGKTITKDVADSTGTISSVVKRDASNIGTGLVSSLGSLNDMLQAIRGTADTTKDTSGKIGDMADTVKGLGNQIGKATETGNRLADLGTLTMGGIGGTTLGALLGYGFSEDPDNALTVSDRRSLENKRMRNAALAAALSGAVGAGAPFAIRHYLNRPAAV